MTRTPTRALTPEAKESLRHALLMVGITEMYLRLFALGGDATEFELDAFAHGLADLPSGEYAVLGQAIWELRRFNN
jgi:hypothetical protein